MNIRKIGAAQNRGMHNPKSGREAVYLFTRSCLGMSAAGMSGECANHWAEIGMTRPKRQGKSEKSLRCGKSRPQ
jgi:hypothetical protein